MLGILLNTLILMGLLKAVNDEEVEFVTALIIAVVASIGTAVLVAAFSFMGIWGILPACALTSLGMAIAISAFFGTAMKQAMIIGFLYLVATVLVSIGFSLLFSVGGS